MVVPFSDQVHRHLGQLAVFALPKATVFFFGGLLFDDVNLQSRLSQSLEPIGLFARGRAGVEVCYLDLDAMHRQDLLEELNQG